MRQTAGSTQQQQMMVSAVQARGSTTPGSPGSHAPSTSPLQKPPTPPVDPENEEFVIFVRSTKVCPRPG